MQVQKVFKAGNSNVVAIPKDFANQGDKVVVENATADVLVIKKSSSDKSSKASQKEFKKWVDVFMKENGEILDELAIR